MYTTPSCDDLLEGVIVSLQNDILPELQTQRAQVALVMSQAVLQMVRQRMPVEQQTMTAECNEMQDVLRDMAAILASTPGPEAERMRQRASTLGARAPLPVPPAFPEVAAAYRELSQSLVDCVRDLDVLIREGNTAGEDALQRMRGHLGPRTMRDFATSVVGAGMAGRG